jgi:AcrR family transcriptional regulator
MARDAELTRRKILEAATREFSEHGIAGARVERITDAAGVNNALLYRYFGNKRDLFDAVYAEIVTGTVAAVEMDPTDLVGYVERLYDHYRTHPEVIRLTIWRELELTDGLPSPETSEVQQDKLNRVAEAQRSDALPADFSPEELMELVLTLSLLGSVVTPTLGTAVDPDRRRQVLGAAMAAILRPGQAESP